MKKSALFILACSYALTGFSMGLIQEGLTLKSKFLKKEIQYSIYLPEGYDQSTRKYPVLYLLHGLNCSHSCWLQQGDLRRIADKSIESGIAPEMIIVMPDAMNTWYMNDVKASIRYEDFFIKEFIPFIDKNFRTRDSKKFRGISGLSMGGFGALLYAIKYPDYFSRCFAMSPAIFTDEMSQNVDMKRIKYLNFDVVYGWDSIPGSKRITPHYLQNSILSLVEQASQKQLDAVNYYVDCGDDDSLLEGNFALLQAMRKRKMKVEFRMRDGAHIWQYWREALPVSMQFVGESFISNR